MIEAMIPLREFSNRGIILTRLESSERLTHVGSLGTFRPLLVLMMLVKPHVLRWLPATALVIVGCGSPRDVIRPVIHTNDDRIAAMKAAPTIIIAEIQQAKLLPGKPREVEKPPGIGGPDMARIPLDLAEFSAKVHLTLRGPEMNHISFYAWVYHFGKHGGPRLFNPLTGSFHIMFLRRELGYLHTVGDYPNYDLVIPSASFPSFLSAWQTGYGENSSLMERIVEVRLRTYLENVSPQDITPYFRIHELTELTSASFVALQLSSHCQRLENQPLRAEACAELTQELDLIR